MQDKDSLVEKIFEETPSDCAARLKAEATFLLKLPNGVADYYFDADMKELGYVFEANGILWAQRISRQWAPEILARYKITRLRPPVWKELYEEAHRRLTNLLGVAELDQDDMEDHTRAVIRDNLEWLRRVPRPPL